MRKFLMTLILALLFPISNALATTPPPSQGAMFPVQSISLSYDLVSASLHVTADHPSANWERDYVRMMTVALNGELVSTLNYHYQKIPNGFSDDVPLKAKIGDVITVELFCTQGSSLSKDLTVTK